MNELYPYQERVLKALAEGKNIILLVPTGGGKTYASLLPFLQNCAFHDGVLPEKALYMVPMRVLTTQFDENCQKILDDLNPEVAQEMEARYRRCQRPLHAVQTGEKPDDPQFESLITACTIDQFLASALAVPYSMDGRRANLNVGATCGSYLILDEPHLYPLANEGRSYKGALTTCLELLRLWKGLTRFVFMSATMSTALVAQLETMLGKDTTEVITVTDQELVQLNKGRERIFERADSALDAEQVLQRHERYERCSLVVCNTVQRAQELYLKLHQRIEQQGLEIELRLLHSRFTDEDRQRQGEELRNLLGKEQWQAGVYQGENVIVIATQVVEVGLDISVQTLHSEIAPANSLIQRAGRCARFEQQQGSVIIYPLPLDKETNQQVSSLPYDATLCNETWSALEKFESRHMGFREEQQLVDLVHTPGDLELLKRYEDHRFELQQTITKSLQTNQRNDVTELIRDVTQVQLLVHNDPREQIKSEPWRWQSFGIHPGLLQGKHWDRLQARSAAGEAGWICKQAVLSKTERTDDEEDNRQPSFYDWENVTNASTIFSSFMLTMPNELITYDPALGLVFLDGRLELPEAWQRKLAQSNYQSALRPRKWFAKDGEATRYQTYQQHIGGLADAYHYAIHHEMAYTLGCLERLLGLAAGTIDQAIQLAIATHDLGKLDHKWQRWARAWQRLVAAKTNWTDQYREPGASYFFAKTDYDYRSKEQREWKKELTEKRPHHACEGVMIGQDLLAASLGVTSEDSLNLQVLRAVCAAIARHHTPQAHEYGETRLDARAVQAFKEAITLVRRDDAWSYESALLNLSFKGGDLDPVNTSESPDLTRPDVVNDPEVLYETWLYFVIVRALRLADQRADLFASFR
jgi:CRISPR-associated endonuclease/helicase Cas3